MLSLPGRPIDVWQRINTRMRCSHVVVRGGGSVESLNSSFAPFKSMLSISEQLLHHPADRALLVGLGVGLGVFCHVHAVGKPRAGLDWRRPNREGGESRRHSARVVLGQC